jgi:hypothetical protein
VAQALATDARVTARIALSVADAAGNRSVMTLSRTLRR